jgi:hypothetical protein
MLLETNLLFSQRGELDAKVWIVSLWLGGHMSESW